MDIHKLIRDNSGIPLEPLPPEPEQVEAKLAESYRKHELQQWKQSPISTELLTLLSNSIRENETRARELACVYHTNQNHLEIINLLVRAEELRKLLKSYGSN